MFRPKGMECQLHKITSLLHSNVMAHLCTVVVRATCVCPACTECPVDANVKIFIENNQNQTSYTLTAMPCRAISSLLSKPSPKHVCVCACAGLLCIAYLYLALSGPCWCFVCVGIVVTLDWMANRELVLCGQFHFGTLLNGF